MEVWTGFDRERLGQLAEALCSLPDDKNYFRKVKKLFKDRRSMVEGDRLDWGLGELLAYGTLLVEGHPVRVSGQDVERGTFSHRHAVVKTEDSEEERIPLNHLEEGQEQLSIYNSHLSEYGVMGFDFGYAYGTPEGLTIWEAQFGDFNNGAQIIIDQFISAGEDKWNAPNGLTLFLPHGYEGMGSEHSSGRMERYSADVRPRQHAGGQSNDASKPFSPFAASSFTPIPEAIGGLHPQEVVALSRGGKYHGRIG